MGSCHSKNTASGVVTAKPAGDKVGASHQSSNKGVIRSTVATPVSSSEKEPQIGSNASTASKKEGGRGGSALNNSQRRGLPPHPATSNAVDHVPGYSSGASTPVSLDGSNHSRGSSTGRCDTSNIGTSSHGKNLIHSSSVLGLDKLIDDRRHEGDLKNNIVHMEVPFGKPIEEVYDGVHDGPVLGSGISGLVRLCTHKATGAKYAVKCLDLGLVETPEGLQQLREEIAIMCQLDHPNIVRLEEVYESHSEIYLVQELCVGGELFDRLDEQPDYHYTEAQCAKLVKQMLCSVRYIHSKGIIHRDLKLENFLFSNTNADSELKMIDFGLSKHFKFGEVQHEAVGTPYTVAPEVIRGTYDERCDVWAIGVIAFLLLSGDPPFGGCGGPEPLMQVRSNILRGAFQFEPEEIWANVSQLAREFIRDLLVTDPNFRPTARECQKSAWLREWANKDRKTEDNKLNPNVVKALVNFKEYSDMRKLLCEVLSFTLLPDQITDLRKEFEKLDTDGSGEISLAGLKKVLIQNAGAGSLGALTEEEVEDIFNAMRVRKTETRIHWHEFIAAGLSQCKVDERNLRLAFERLDSDHKGYITFDNVMDLMGRDAAESEDAMRAMWGDSMKACQSQNARITYDDFLLLMKGQTKEDFQPKTQPQQNMISHGSHGGMLDVLHEEVSFSGSQPGAEPTRGRERDEMNTGLKRINGTKMPIHLEKPTTPLYAQSADDLDDISDGPLSMDDDELDERISASADRVISQQMKAATNSEIISLPVGLSNEGSRRSSAPNLAPAMDDVLEEAPNNCDLPSKPAKLNRRLRSRSVDAGDTNEDKDEEIDYGHPHFAPDARRALLLPEHTHMQKDIEILIKDETKTPLVVNRKLYRAHRQMRLAVLEASKRFEDEQLKRTKEELRAKQEAEGSVRFAAGLVMRHGHSKELSSESIRLLMKQKQKEQETLVEKATRRGGRGRRTRKKTISDMSGMLASVPPNEMMIERKPASQLPLLGKQASISEIPSSDLEDMESNLQLHETAHRKPTVPGDFRKTNDPFLLMGMELGVTNAKNMNRRASEESNGANSSEIKLSVSDGNLNARDEIPESPTPSKEGTVSKPTQSSEHEQKINASPSWPPPPQL